MRFSDLFPSMYLKGVDLKDKPDLEVTIYEIQREMIRGDEKPVVNFRETKQGLALNVTNGKIIKELAGSDNIDKWEGLKIYLYHTMVNMKGEMVDAIRVRTKAELDDIPTKFPKPKGKSKKKKA